MTGCTRNGTSKSMEGCRMQQWPFIPLFFTVFLMAACGAGEESGGTEEGGSEDGAAEAPSEEIEVTMYDTEEEPIGTAVLSETEEDGLTIALEAEGLEPGEHGMHIHDAVMCEGPNFETAGSHFNPTDASHGF